MLYFEFLALVLCIELEIILCLYLFCCVHCIYVVVTKGEHQHRLVLLCNPFSYNEIKLFQFKKILKCATIEKAVFTGYCNASYNCAGHFSQVSPF